MLGVVDLRDIYATAICATYNIRQTFAAKVKAKVMLTKERGVQQ